MRILSGVLILVLLSLGLYLAIGPGNLSDEVDGVQAEVAVDRNGGPTSARAGEEESEPMEVPSKTRSDRENGSEQDLGPSIVADRDIVGTETGVDSTDPSTEDSMLSRQSPFLGKDDSKVNSIIRQVIEDLKEDWITPGGPKSEGFRSHSVDGIIRLDDSGKIQTYVYTEGSAGEAGTALENLGARVEIVNEEWGVVQAWIPYDRIDRVAELESVKRIETPDYGFTNAGAITTEGDSILRANQVREELGFTGSGIKVGVISDGVVSRASAQASGDLPESIQINPDLPGGDEHFTGDEGTAMLEIIHDIAPGASLSFSAGKGSVPTSLEMVETIDWLADDAFGGSGADIIVDDLSFGLQPFFEDGLVALKVKEVVTGGAVYLSSAGNSANSDGNRSRGHYEGEFDDDGNGFHEFGDGDISMRVSLGERGFVVLQWNDQFGSSGNDYNLYGCVQGVTPSQTSLDSRECVVSSSVQDGDDDPIEWLVSPFSAGFEVDLYIEKSSGSTRRLEIYLFNAIVLEYNVAEGSIYGHAAVSGALAVGAINAVDSGHDTIAPYSSQGASEIYYPVEETRMKPDLVAIDGVSITGAGGFPSPFYGTSAAAPHAAAVAALVLEAIREDDSTITKAAAAQQVFNTLRGTSVDLGDSGTDNVFGAGRVDAEAAVSSVSAIVSFEQPIYTAVESGHVAAVVVDLSSAVNQDVLIPIAVTTSGADSGDYTLGGLEGSAPNYNLRITANALTASISVTADADTDDEDGDSVTLQIGATLPTGVLAGTTTTAKVNLLDSADAVDYDSDDDNLINISSLGQLNAIRWDLDGNGAVDLASDAASYDAAFPNATPGAYTGYELTANLDFDTDDSGSADEGDDYWNDGAGWFPVDGFNATFDGGDYTISNLFINRSGTNNVGLFGQLPLSSLASAEIRNVGLVDANVNGNRNVGGLVGRNLGGMKIAASSVSGSVTGPSYVGGLVGFNAGSISASHVSGGVTGWGDVGGLVGWNTGEISVSHLSGSVTGLGRVGGLVGFNTGIIISSYAEGSVLGTGVGFDVGGLVGRNFGTGKISASYATCEISGIESVGGLVGENEGTISASYAKGRVSGENIAGGLVGDNDGGKIRSSYATGAVTSGESNAGGLVGRDDAGGIVASYWDTDASGQPGSVGGEGKTTTVLQSPTDYSGIYSSWNVDIDNADDDDDETTGTDDPWDFGSDSQYPALEVDYDVDSTATWKEFGYQFREGLVLTATAQSSQIGLSWTAVVVSHWDPAPSITYTIYRDGTSLKTGLTGSSFSDSAVTVGDTYTYQVAAVVNGGASPLYSTEQTIVLTNENAAGVCGRGGHARDAIVAAISGVELCDNVTTENLTTITLLNLDNQDVIGLAEGDFEGLSNLETLSLQSNEIRSLPEDVFDGLTNLKSLSLVQNRLTSLPAGVFEGLSNLKWLTIEKNELRSLPEDVFDGLSKLVSLRLNENRLTSLPAEVFDGLSNLGSLSLRANELTALPEGVFDGLSSLHGLNLGENQLTSLSAEVFDDLTNLTTLTLNDNRLSTLPAGIFDGLIKFYSLSLHRNRLVTLPAGVFDGMVELDALLLSENRLTTLPAGVFDDLVKLRVLLLEKNQLRTLPAGVFNGLTSLEHLNLSFNLLTTLPAGHFGSTSNLTKLKRLYLGDNLFTTLPAGVFAGLSNLQVLRLSSNRLTTLPVGLFNGLSNLQELSLPWNSLTSLSAGVFGGLSNLQTLDLSFNDLNTLSEGAFEGLTSMQFLDLSNNPGAPFTLTLVVEPVGRGPLILNAPIQLRVRIVEGAPFATTVTWTATGDIVGTGSATVPAGSLVSEPFTLPSEYSGGEVSVTLSNPAFDGITEEIGDGDGNIRGLALSGGEPLVLAPGVCGRGSTVRDSILARIVGVDNCSDVTAEHLASIGLLYLSEMAITSLASNDFDGLTNLERLFLQKNSLTSLSEDQFAVLTNLEVLWLGGNNLTTLPEGLFEGLTELRSLLLQENSLTSLSEDQFKGLANLQKLWLGGNSLTTLPEDLFEGLTSLESLSLRDNPLGSLSEDLFDDLTNLRSLELQSSNLTALPAGIFEGLIKLEELRLGGNSLTTLPVDLFEDLTNLESLLLIDSPLGSLSEDLFDDLTNLTDLSLQGLSLTTLPPGIFEDLTNLQKLVLRRNQFSTLPAGLLNGLTNLQELLLSDNSLSTLPAGVFTGLSNLQELDLGGNSLSMLSAGVFDPLTGLEGLGLQANGMTTLSVGLLNGLTNLQELLLSDNSLSTLPAGVFTGLSNLQELDLGGNSLSMLPAGVFDPLTGLEGLGLQANGLTTLPAGLLNGLTNLRVLLLSDNSLSTLPAGVFTGLSNLQELDLGGNSLSMLSAGVFDPLTGLEGLGLQANGMTTLPAGLLNGLTNLQELLLSDNSLSTLPAGVFTGLSNLQELDLGGNSLTTLPAGVFDPLTSLEGLGLQANGLTTLPAGLLNDLTNLRELFLNENSLSTLPAGVFAGLSNLEVLHLAENDLITLTAGLFDGLTNLRELHLDRNPGTPFTLTVQLEQVGSDPLSRNVPFQLRVRIAEGAPFATTVTWTATGDIVGTASGSATVPAGSLVSEPFSLTSAYNVQEVTVTLSDPAFDGVSEEIGDSDGDISGLALAGGEPLVLDFVPNQNPVAVGAIPAQNLQVGGTALTLGLASHFDDPENGPLTYSVSSSDTEVATGMVSNSTLTIDPVEGGSATVTVTASDPGGLTVTQTIEVTVEAVAPPLGEEFGGGQVVPGVPKGEWTPDRLSRAEYTHVGGETTIVFRHGGRMEEDGVTYTCMTGAGCTIESTSVTTGAVMVSETAGETELMLAGVAELVDDQTGFQGETYNGYELDESTVTLRSAAGETTRISFLDPDGDLVFVDFSSDDPATEMVITLEGFSGTLEESPYDQPDTLYARGLATVTMINPTELTWLQVVSLGNHVDRVDLALIEADTFAGEVDGIADIKAVVIEGEASIGVIDAANSNFVGSSGEIGIDAAGTVVKRALSIGDITPSEGALPVLRISGTSLDPANAGAGETVIAEIQIAGGDLREATGALQIDTGGIVYDFPIVAVDGERSIRDSELRPDLGDGVLEAVTDTFVAKPDDYFVTDGQRTGLADSTE